MAIHSHLLLMTLYAALLSVVAATLLENAVRDQVRTGAKVFGGLMAGAVALGWLLYVFPL
jgi:hypothetical protein